MTTRISLSTSFIFVLMFTVLTGCGKKEPKETELKTFAVRGEVVGIDTVKMRVTIAHEEIPNYMMAMTMPFKVKDRALLQDISIGDSVLGTLAVSRTESWLETLTSYKKGETPPGAESAEQILMAKMFKTGEPLPDVQLVNQAGKTIRLSDFRGKVVALTFIYTRCPLPDFCIRMSDNFEKLQKILSEDRSADSQWHLLTISFDPKFDRPKVLKQYGKSYGADFSVWDFATDPDTSGPAIMKLADGLGLTYANDEGLIAHNLRTVILDKEGKLVKVINGNEWKPEEVAAEMNKLM